MDNYIFFKQIQWILHALKYFPFFVVFSLTRFDVTFPVFSCSTTGSLQP